MSSWRPDEDSDDSDSGDEYENFSSGREAIIFLIDAFLSENPEVFQECLDIIKKALLNGLLIKNKDLIGIVFYNTKLKPDPKDIEGIKNIVVKENTAILLPLKQLSKDIVSYYLDFSTADHFDFENKYGCTTGNFANAIWLCTNMFKQAGCKLLLQSIILFTDKDVPPDVEGGNFQKAIKKATDLNEVEIDFTVIPMSNDFDYNKFYKEFICTVQDIELDDFVEPNIEDEKRLVSERQLKQNFKKRCEARLRFSLGDGVDLSVAIYNYFRKNVYPKSVKVFREDDSIINVKRINKLVSLNEDEYEAGTSEEKICKPSDQRKVVTIGGETISFTLDELAKLRSPLSPGITLIGFKPRSEISIHNFIKSSSFIYPDEKMIEGSTKLFCALWEKCIEKDVVGFCVLVSRRKSQPRFVALIPTSSTDGCNDDYDGFKVFYLPSEIDFRDIDLSEWGDSPDVSDKQVEIFQKIIKKLKFSFAPTKIHDPSLEKLHIDMIGLAFDVEAEEEPNYDIIDVQEQNAKIQPFLKELTELFGVTCDEEDPKKRKGRGEGSQTQPKVARTDNCTDEQISHLISIKKLDQLTVQQLKTYLQNKNVKGMTSATKPKLIEKVLEINK